MKKGLKLFFTGNYKSRYPLETPVMAGGVVLTGIAMFTTSIPIVMACFCTALVMLTLLILSIVNVICSIRMSREEQERNL